MDIKITNPIPEDAEGINNIFYKTWLSTYPNQKLGITMKDIEDKFEDFFSFENIKKRQDWLKNIPPTEKVMVAKYDNLLVGVVRLIKNKNNNELRAIYVLPNYQGKGIGTMMWNEIKNFIDKSKDTIVVLADYNEKAKKFYEKLGFIDTGKRWNYDGFNLKSGSVIPVMEMVLKV